MTYQVDIDRRAERELARIERRDRQRIAAAIAKLADDPRPAGALKMSGRDHDWRIRIGNYRVIYRIQDDVLTIIVIQIGHRRDIYQ